MKKNSASEIYNQIAKLAKKAGITPGRYAEDRGVSRSLLSKWKTGRIKTIKIEVAKQLGFLQ